MKTKQKILILVGPTSSGKSTLAVELARALNGEVISADSRQVYRGLDIGTGKITKHEMKGIPHHLLDVASPKKRFTAHDFAKRASAAIRDIVSRDKLPIIAGGTGLYIDALTGRITLPNVAPDPTLREKLSKKSIDQLYAMLRLKDSKRATTMSTPSERNNKVRLIRALEIASARKATKQSEAPAYDALWIGIAPSLKVLERKIETRLKSRIKQGMIAEATRLHADGLSYKRMHELGLEYRSLALLLQKKISREQMFEELNRAIRKYAKRQMVYWKRNADIKWFAKPEVKHISKAIRQWI